MVRSEIKDGRGARTVRDLPSAKAPLKDPFTGSSPCVCKTMLLHFAMHIATAALLHRRLYVPGTVLGYKR